MKTLYITSVEPYSGKSAVCLALGKKLQDDGYRIGYLKPMSTQPWRTAEGKLVDQDADFVQRTLQLEEDSATLSPVIVTPTSLRARLSGASQENLVDTIQAALKTIQKDKDIVLLEGGASLREGYAIGLSNISIAEELAAPVVVIIKYSDDMQTIDDAIAAQFRLGEQLMCVILNQVPDEVVDTVNTTILPFLEQQGINVFGVLPKRPRLSAISVGRLVEELNAEILTRNINPDSLIESFSVGAMTIEAALSRFRQQRNKAVITGGDRADIQLAALETSTVALILTGNLHPSPLVIQQAESLKTPILLVKRNTMETVDVIETIIGKTRLGEPEKLEEFMQLMDDRQVFKSIFDALGLAKAEK